MEEENGRWRKSSDDDGMWWWALVLVLPYLNPPELASISSTCKPLHQFSKSVTRRRISDASRGFEKLPIPFIAAQSQPPYSYFLYTPTQTLHVSPDFRQPWGSDPPLRPYPDPDPFLFRVEGAIGCGCAAGCAEPCCPCLECGPSCECGPGRGRCGNRVSQGGVEARLKIVKDERKGWGLFAAEFIPTRRFLCEYAGEVLCTKEAKERQKRYDKEASMGGFSSALLVVKEHLPSGNTCMRINIDATVIGNVARFINHSCDGGNLDTVIVRSSGALLPRVCFFASRDIREDEELSFNYGDLRLNPNGRLCFCGTASCAGVLPSEHT